MSQPKFSQNRTPGRLGVGCLFAAVAWLGLGCSSNSGNSSTEGRSGQNSAGQTSSGSGLASGGQGARGGQSQGGASSNGGSSRSPSSGGSSSSGGQTTSSSARAGNTGGSGSTDTNVASGGRGGSTGGTSGSTTGGTSGGGTSGTGGTATGGTVTGASSQGGQGGGAGSSGPGPSSDAGVDRVPDSSAPNHDSGSVGDFCPSNGPCAIMPLGDSITDGMGSSGGGYRVPLFNLALTDNKTITFVGGEKNGPASVSVNGQTKPFPQNHEGHIGWTIQDGGGRSGIYGIVDERIKNNMPHIVLLMIGTNDVNLSLDLTNAPKRLDQLLEKIIADAPKALIVVAKLVPTTNDTINGRVRTYNDGISSIVQSRISAGKNLKIVDMYAAFTANTSYKTALMNDELHPKDAGYSVMAQTWYDAIKSYLH
jgi:hypothetical protein